MDMICAPQFWEALKYFELIVDGADLGFLCYIILVEFSRLHCTFLSCMSLFKPSIHRNAALANTYIYLCYIIFVALFSFEYLLLIHIYIFRPKQNALTCVGSL